MNSLYIIGGSPRCGKTNILNEILRQKPMVAISSDAIRAGVRYSAKRLLIADNAGKSLSPETIENTLPWNMMVGLIQYYDNKDISLIIEGDVITPERVKSLTLKNLQIRAAFVGYTDATHLDTIINYAHLKKDWVQRQIEEQNGDETAVREQLGKEVENSKQIAAESVKYGYEFFSPEASSFEEYQNKVVGYLIKNDIPTP